MTNVGAALSRTASESSAAATRVNAAVAIGRDPMRAPSTSRAQMA
jgi:hypothetical protein